MPGALVPLYTDPGPVWDQLASAIAQTPDLPFAVVINPNSGAGAASDPSYVAALPAFDAPNVTVYGYIDTDFARREHKSIVAEMDDWIRWYDVAGFFFDDVASGEETLSYYTQLVAAARARRRATIGNPGTLAPTTFGSLFDTLIVYEDPGGPPARLLERAAERFSRERTGVIALGVAHDDGMLDELIHHAYWIYVSERTADAYCYVPTAFDSFLDRLHIANAADFDLHPGL